MDWSKLLRPGAAAFLALSLTLIALAACTSEPPARTPAQATQFPPFYPTEADALAAVDAFMQEYLAAVTAFRLSRGSDGEVLRSMTTDQQFRDEQEAVSTLAAQGDTFQGEYGYFGLNIQQFNQDSEDEAFIQAYVCIDYRSTSYLRADGSVFEREAQWGPFEAVMTSEHRIIRLDELRRWTGRNFCDLAQQR